MTRNNKLAINIASKIVRMLASKQHGVLPRFFNVIKIDPNKPVRRKKMHAQQIFKNLGWILNMHTRKKPLFL